MEKEIIIRNIRSITANDDKTISGSAIVFDIPSDTLYDGGTIPFVEIIHKGAITHDTINRSDIKLTYNHQSKTVPIARSNKGKGSLKVMLTDDTVDFSTPVKNTNSAQEIYEAIRAGDLSGCSFVGTLLPSDHKLERQNDNSYIHHIYNIQEIKDLSIVDSPAYPETSVIARQLQEQVQVDEERNKEIERNKELEFQKYYEKIKMIYLIK